MFSTIRKLGIDRNFLNFIMATIFPKPAANTWLKMIWTPLHCEQDQVIKLAHGTPTDNIVFGVSTNTLRNENGKRHFRIRRKRFKASFFADDNIIHIYLLKSIKSADQIIEQGAQARFLDASIISLLSPTPPSTSATADRKISHVASGLVDPLRCWEGGLLGQEGLIPFPIPFF